ncbi:MAG: sialate O-acetylesterase, partial [Planctomycetes bacterium]|nr:sialate O-acetylesterase [Planctomycetota bacterium]
MNYFVPNKKLQVILTQCILLTAVVANFSVAADAHVQTLELGSPFVDNAILQRDMPVPAWGWARPGSTVTLTFGAQTKTTTVDARGSWRVKLDPLKASLKERELKVTTPTGESVTCTGVLVGEVWFASGQSNMDWVAGKSMCRDLANTLQRSEQDIPVREFNADMGSSLFFRERVASEHGWKTPGQAGSFSALSLAFAWDLYQALKVPIGIVRSTHGATPIETWTPYEGVASHAKLQDIALRIRQSDPSTADSQEAYTTFFQALKQWQVQSEAILNQGGDVLARPALPGIADDWKGATRMYNFKIAPLVPYAIRGMIWCQGTHNASDGRIYAAKMEALLNGLRQAWDKPDLPFYFTQMQCYGDPDPDQIGFADIREAQTLFFVNNEHVGMAAQYDLNSARPQGIHNYNKLDPGKRLARWALAHEYGSDMAYCGPIFKSYTVKGSTVRVQFEQRGPGAGLMVASKGMQADMKDDPSAYVEPARETPGESLKHFRVCGKDRVWHAADAHIQGNAVVVTSKAVPNPIGVQYAYSASPIGANLYNRAGLPATPFAYIDGKQFFKEDDAELVAAERAEAERRYSRKPFLLPMSLLRDHGVMQRDMPVPIWGHGVPGTEIIVTFGSQTKKTTVGTYEKWRVRLDPMPASKQGRDLEVMASDGDKKQIKDMVV